MTRSRCAARPDSREAGLVIEREEQPLHRLAKARVAEVVEAGPPAGLREQGVGVEGASPKSHQPRSGAIRSAR